MVALAVDPHLLPAGNCPQRAPARYGFGRSLRAPSIDTCGSFTGYCPGGNWGSRGPLPVWLAPTPGRAPQDWASDPADPRSACALTIFAATMETAIIDPRHLRFTPFTGDIKISSRGRKPRGIR